MNCNDGPGCDKTSMDVCERFPSVKNRCQKTCQDCVCQDVKDCQGITMKHCLSIPETLNKTCALTCKVCGRSNGKLTEYNRSKIFFHPKLIIIALHLFLKLLLVSCAGKKCQTRISNRCVDGECRCGMSPKCNPRSLERHCLAFDWTRPLKNDTTATCKSGIIILF